MKASRYNRLLATGDGGLLAFNGLSAALLRVRPEKREAFERVLVRPDTAASDEERRFVATLTEKKFLLDDGFDELAHLAALNRRHRVGSDLLSLSVAPTLACNFRCEYCYERPSAERMGEETQRALLGFADRRMRASDDVSVTWYGGEPTLCLETIERVQAGLKELAERRGATLRPSGIVTNGWLLDLDAARRLVTAGVTTAQVTLDGPKKVHDERRKLAGGGGTFDRILSNLTAVADLLRVAVRINVDERNAGAATEVVRHLQRLGLAGKVSVHFAQVRGSSGTCADLSDVHDSVETFSRRVVEFYRELTRDGFEEVDYPAASAGGCCGANSDRAFVVAPDGTLFKCWEEISDGEASAVGTVLSDSVTPAQRVRLDRYLSWDPLASRECRECEVLPLCMGGCPRDAIRGGEEPGQACCASKHNLDEILRLRGACGRLQPKGG